MRSSRQINMSTLHTLLLIVFACSWHRSFGTEPPASGSTSSAGDWNITATPTTRHVQEDDDIIPVIIGGVLALMVVVTLIGYLIYRSRLSPETLHMTTPNSHFEDNSFENKGRVMDDEDSSDADSHNHQRSHANNKH